MKCSKQFKAEMKNLKISLDEWLTWARHRNKHSPKTQYLQMPVIWFKWANHHLKKLKILQKIMIIYRLSIFTADT